MALVPRSPAVSFRPLSRPPHPHSTISFPTPNPHHHNLRSQFSNDTKNPSTMLQKDCALAMRMLRRVAGSPSVSSGSGGSPEAMLPRDYLKSCAGLLFQAVNTGGFGVVGARGRGFIIAKLGKKDGLTSWSAPAFQTFHAAGVGLSFGFDTIFTVVVLGTPEAVREAAKSGPTMGIEVDLVAGREREVLQSSEDGCPTVPFSVAGGAMLDVSLKGGATLAATKKNAAAYGGRAGGVSVADILFKENAVDRPAEFEPLYELLSALSREHEEFRA